MNKGKKKAEAVTPRPKSCYGTWLTALHSLQDLVRAVETLRSRVPYLADQILWRTVTLGVGGHLVLLCWEVHPLQVLLKLAKVEITKVAQIHTYAPIFASRPPPCLPLPRDPQTAGRMGMRVG